MSSRPPATALRDDKSRSLDGLHCFVPLIGAIAVNKAMLYLSTSLPQRNGFDTSWLDTLPSADNGAELVSTMLSAGASGCTMRVLIAEAFEEAGRPTEAIEFARADLQDQTASFNPPSHVRAGRGEWLATW